jgi:hypothetical protein
MATTWLNTMLLQTNKPHKNQALSKRSRYQIHKKEQSNIRNRNPPPLAVEFTHSGDVAPVETKQTVNDEDGVKQNK